MDPKREAMDRALAASRLQKAWIAGDRDAGRSALCELYSPGMRAVLGLGDDSSRRAICTTLEVATSAVLQFWFGEDSGEAWRELMIAGPDGLPSPGLASNASLLRQAGSSVVETQGTPLDIERFATNSIGRQARTLAHICLLADAATPIDYAALYSATHPELREFLSAWLLSAYLTSPAHQFSAEALENQRVAREAYARVHGPQNAVAPQIAFTALAYRTALDEGSPKAFLEALNRSVFRPALAGAGFEPAPVERGEGIGVILESAGRGGKIDRRTGRSTELLRSSGARGVLVSEQVETAYSNLPDGWRDEDTDVLGLPASTTFEGLAASAASIRSEGLDTLVYPQASLGISSRWLASERLARVQVSLGSDAITTGSDAIDYIVVGEELAGDGSEYTEQVLTVPGLGLDIAPPPVPREPRERPLDDARTLLVSTATHEKLSGPVLDAWNAILARSDGKAVLHFFPSVDDITAGQYERDLGQHFQAGSDALLVPKIERQELVDLLVEADLFLDTYPHGGLGALVEALCCGLPAITIEGDSARNRAGAAVLRRLGLPEGLIAKDLNQYVEVACALIEDTALRLELRALLDRDRILEILIDSDLPTNVAAAVDLARRLGPRHGAAPTAPIHVPTALEAVARMAS